MFCKRKGLLKLGIVIITAAVLVGPSVAVARQSAGGLTGGARLRPGTFATQRVSHHDQYARNCSRDIYHYSRDTR